ncbi:MAG: amidohydrolase [Bacteroidales bacterium]|nr:amidohydrolase [Bacteroidales bacterium]MBN2699004.1 amidohydrolase [Bacteroidales bacterium]
MDLKDQIKERSEYHFGEMVRIRTLLHRYPELSFEEYKTSETIRSVLNSWGIEYDFPYVKTGILARLSGKRNGRTVALRADMDALPISEPEDRKIHSLNNGVMHACGHDIHMTALLGAIRILKDLCDSLRGQLLFIFQPGEEKIPGGARLMLEEGIFSRFKPDLIIAQHVLPSMETGKAGFRPGMYMASSDEIYLTVTGKGGHGAMPEQINDPVLMTSHILISLQQEINRKTPRHTPTVISFGKVIADGAVNVIPNQVRVEGTFRTMDESYRKQAHEMIRKIAKGIAESMGGSCEIEIRKGYPVLINDEKVTSLARNYAIDLLGSDHIEELERRMTAEDFAWFANAYPATMFRLGIKPPDALDETPLHTPEFAADESALKTGASLLSYLAIRFLNEEAF